jgi:hypothetical protein
MRRWLALAAGLCLTLTIAVPVSADGTVTIRPFSMDEATAHVGDTVVLSAGWGACSKGLDVAFTRAARVEWSINGVPFPTTPVWTKPVPETSDAFAACLNGLSTIWWVSGQYPTTFAVAGTYTVSVVMSIPHPLPDGGDWDGDGKADKFGGPFVGDLTLTVTE